MSVPDEDGAVGYGAAGVGRHTEPHECGPSGSTVPTVVRYALPIAGFVLLTAAMTWPLVRRAGSVVQDHGDPLYDIWSMRWFQHQILTDPGRLWDANILYPYQRAFVFSEPQISSAILSWPVRLLTGNDVLAYNLLLLSTFVVLGVGVALLIEEWSGNGAAGILAGLFAAYTPYRFGHISHLNLLAYGYLPLALWAISRYCRRQRASDAVMATVLLTVQVLASDTLAALALVAVTAFIPFAFWSVARRPRIKDVIALGLVLAVPVLALLPLVVVRFEVNRRYGFVRDLTTIDEFSATPATYLSVGPFNRFWRGILPEAYPSPLFPGALVLVLAVVGTPAAFMSRPRLAVYALGLWLGGGLLSLGPRTTVGDLTVTLPYQWLYTAVPGMSSMRDPSRFGTLALLGMQLLAGLGAAAMWARMRPRLPSRSATSVGVGLLALLSIVAFIEFRSDIPAVPVPNDPAKVAVSDWLRQQPRGAVLELPANGLLLDEPRTIRQMYYSTRHWQPLVAGYTSFYPRGYLDFLIAFNGGPEPVRQRSDISEVSGANVGLLQDIGVRYVVLHRSEAYNWRRALAEAVKVPELTRLAEVGDSVVFELDPGRRRPLVYTLAAPASAAPASDFVATLAVRNDNDTSAVRLAGVPPSVRFAWRDPNGRVVAEGGVPITVPVVEPGGTALPIRLRTPRAAGEFGLELDFGDLATPLQATITVTQASPVGTDAPPLRVAAVTAPNTAQPDEIVTVFVEMRIGQELPADFTATVQLLGPDGRVVSQSDGQPFRGLYPTSAWRPGSILLLPLTVRTPSDASAGAYTLLVALYDPATPGQPRLPLSLPDGATVSELLFGPLEIARP